MKKQYVKQSLLTKGMELFSRYGLAKTTIHDLTKEVGIATGTFYNYYSSKEELYFAILEQEEVRIRKKLLNSQVKNSLDLEILLKQTLHELRQNPFIKQLYTGDQLQAISSKLPSETFKNHLLNDEKAWLTIIENWQTANLVIIESPQKIAGIIRGLFLLTLHEEKIGKETIDWYIKQIVVGLTKEEGANE